MLRDVDRVLDDSRIDRFLLVGDDLPDGFEGATSTRFMPSDGATLPTGVYRFLTENGVDVMLVVEGAPSGSPASDNWSAPDSTPLIQAYAWFSAWWSDAKAVTNPRFEARDSVVTIPAGQEAVVKDRLFDRGRWSYKIRVDGRTTMVPESGIAYPDFDDDPSEWVRRDPAPVERFAATLTRVKLREQLTDTVFSFRATRTIFRPYQFRPVIRLLETGRGRLNILIADEVGLGKTIEAGLIWTEMDARNQADRVLVVCPSMLQTKWRAEMEERFGFETTILNKEVLDEFMERVENDRLPKRYRAICSLERLRGFSGLERLAELSPRFDLIIVDEAHAFRNQGTKSHALGALLSDWADALVFLSATPLNLGNDDLYNLLELLAPGEFDSPSVLSERLEPNALLNRISASLLDREVDNLERQEWLARIHELTFGPAVVRRPEFAELEQVLARAELAPSDVVAIRRLISALHALSAVVTRTRKVEIQDDKPVREAWTVDVRLTDVEAELYLAIDKWQRARAKAKRMPVAFVGQMPLRLASSCLPAARDKILARDAKVWRNRAMDDADDFGADEDVAPREVIELAQRLGDLDTKFDAFVDPLRRIVDEGRQVLVFTFSRDTLAYLLGRLSECFRVGELHGGVRHSDRADTMKAFRAKQFDVLVASRVASEGLDFEFCSAVVNYDLPWNPMEVEQRIGRVDRFGQVSEKVVVLNFHTPGTIETDIIERVHHRIGVFNDSIGELEPILQSRLSEIREAMFDFSLTDEQRKQKLDAALVAIEAKAAEAEEVESASHYLASTDRAQIEGLEDDLVSKGRYVGQPELVRLLDDWVAGDQNARLSLSTDRRWLRLRGTPMLEGHLMGVQAAGERSAAELADLAAALRDEREISVCLDQELARQTTSTLLSANHPLVRAALRVPGYDQARFSSVRIEAPGVPVGTYVVLIALAHWKGARSLTEFWTATQALDGSAAEEAVGAAVLASLAEARIEEGPPVPAGDLARLVTRAERQLLRKHEEVTARRVAENDSLVEARRISLQESHATKIRQIGSRIATLRRKGSIDVIRLHESQRTNQDRLLSEALAELEASRQGSMEVEPVAVCVVEVD